MELDDAYDVIRAEGAELLAISTDSLENARLMQELTGARFPVLADPDHAVTSAYGIFDLLGDGVSAPATYVLTPRGITRHVGEDIGDRVPAAAIIDFLRQVNAVPGNEEA